MGMAKCKDCLLVEMCYIIENYDADTNDDDVCENFKDRQNYVEVVRCKDCKHMEMTPDCLRWCHVWQGINGMGDDGFCNYGERKDNDST